MKSNVIRIPMVAGTDPRPALSPNSIKTRRPTQVGAEYHVVSKTSPMGRKLEQSYREQRPKRHVVGATEAAEWLRKRFG